MGKRRNKNKTDRENFTIFSSGSPKAGLKLGSDDSDDASCATHLTQDHDTLSSDEENVTDTVTPFDQLCDILDKTTNKNASIRLTAMSNIKTLLTDRYIAPDLRKWTATLLDIIEKALRKTDEDAEIAAALSVLISIQLGEKIANEIESVVSVLCQLCTDPARNIQLRNQCACSVALCTHLCLEHPISILGSVAALRSIWLSAKSSAASVKLFCTALSGWSLLICQTLLTRNACRNEVRAPLYNFQGGPKVLRAALLDGPKLSTFLHGTQLEMRLGAGKALVVLHEAAVTTFGESYHFPNQQYLLDIFANLATDSLKFRAKEDRKIQKFMFRQMYASMKDQEAPVFDVKFGDETLSIKSYQKKILYELICHILHGSVNFHLKKNPILREQFDLEPMTEIFPEKIEKLRRVAIQNAINKTRDLQRLKQRDKRSV